MALRCTWRVRLPSPVSLDALKTALSVTALNVADWFDDEMHRSARRVGVDLTKSVHTYTIRWREIGVDFLIDGILMHKVRGTAGVDIPWEPMSIRVILRPKNLPSYYLGEAHVEIAHMSYVPAYSARTAPSNSEGTGLSAPANQEPQHAAEPQKAAVPPASMHPPPPHPPSPRPPSSHPPFTIVHHTLAPPPPSQAEIAARWATLEAHRHPPPQPPPTKVSSTTPASPVPSLRPPPAPELVPGSRLLPAPARPPPPLTQPPQSSPQTLTARVTEDAPPFLSAVETGVDLTHEDVELLGFAAILLLLLLCCGCAACWHYCCSNAGRGGRASRSVGSRGHAPGRRFLRRRPGFACVASSEHEDYGN